MSRYPNERFLDEILSTIRVARLSCYEVDEPVTIAVVKALKCAWAPLKVRRYELLVRQVLQGSGLQKVRQLFRVRVDHLYRQIKRGRPRST